MKFETKEYIKQLETDLDFYRGQYNKFRGHKCKIIYKDREIVINRPYNKPCRHIYASKNFLKLSKSERKGILFLYKKSIRVGVIPSKTILELISRIK